MGICTSRLELLLIQSQEEARREREMLMRNQLAMQKLLVGTYEMVVRDNNAYDQITATRSTSAKAC